MSSEYYLKNREKILEQTRLRRLAFPQKRKEQQRMDIERNGEKRRAKQAEWRACNPEKILASRRRYYEENKAAIYEKNKSGTWTRERQAAYMAEYRIKNKEKILASQKKWGAENLDKVRATKKRHAENSVQCQISKTLRVRIRGVLRRANGKKAYKTMHLIGCNIEFLIKRLETMFEPGMSWDNHGRNGWHIDHIVPCASFDLTDESQQLKCFHYSNLQPLWAFDNLSKGKKVI